MSRSTNPRSTLAFAGQLRVPVAWAVRSGVLSACLALLLSFASPVLAQQGAEACVDVHFESLCMNGSVAAAESLTRVAGDGGGTYRLAIGSAEARPGQLHVSSYANGEQVGTQALAFARFTDSLTITAPVPPGTLGVFTARFRVDGTLQASNYNFLGNTNLGFARGSVLAQLRVSPPGQLVVEDQLTGERTSAGVFNGNESGFLEAEVIFQFGQPFPVRLFLQAFANGNGQNFGAGAAGIARASYGNSAYWTGITSIETLDGDPVPVFAVTSVSGADYRTDFSADPVFRHNFEQ